MEIKDVFKKSIATKSLLDNYHDLALPSRICYDLYSAVEAHQIKYDNANFYVLSEDSDINRIVKIATLMPSTITLTNLNSIVTQIDHGVWYENGQFIEYEVNCHLPSKEFFLNYGDLLTEGIIQYYPNTAYYLIYPDGKEEWSKTNTIEHPNAVLESETKESTLELFRNLITLDIPYIYDTSISDFSKITVNNIDSLKNFKRLFKKEILNIDFTKEKEKADFEYTMNSAVNQLGVKYKQENSKLRKNIIIGSIATVATSLLVFSDINQLTSCLAGLTEGAGLIHFMKQLFDFRVEKIALKDNDYYFLWLIKKASK